MPAKATPAISMGLRVSRVARSGNATNTKPSPTLETQRATNKSVNRWGRARLVTAMLIAVGERAKRPRWRELITHGTFAG